MATVREFHGAFSAIYAPIDRGSESKNAVPLARTIARISGAALHLVHATEKPVPPTDLCETLDLHREEMEDAILEQEKGPADEAISRTANRHENSMIVAPLSPDAEQILKSAICPVVLVPSGFDWKNWKPSRILLPQDSTADTASAIGPAAAFGREPHAELLVLHVPTYSQKFSADEAAFPYPRYMDQPQHELPAWRQEFLDRLRELGHVPDEMKMHLLLGVGQPGEEILIWAKKLSVDLIAMPWHGRFETADVLKEVLRGAPCPVMVLRRPKRAR